MTHTAHRPRRTRMLFAALAAGALLALPLTATPFAATAAPSGYLGDGDNSPFDAYGGTRELPLMTAGEPYSGTLTGPQFAPGMSWCWSITDGAPPSGITMSVSGECAPTATFSGTPAAGAFEFELTLSDTARETHLALRFTGTVESGKTPTVTTIAGSAPDMELGAASFTATVVGDPPGATAPSGTVQFSIVGGAAIGTAPLVDGTASLTTALAAVLVGDTLAVEAVYAGDDDYQGSTSAPVDARLYAAAAEGEVRWNGALVTGATVELRPTASPETVLDSTQTDSSGAFRLSPGVLTADDLTTTHLIRVVYADDAAYYAGASGLVGDAADAAPAGPLTWVPMTLARATAPVWTDAVLATPREGSAYTDGVAASSPNPVSYELTAGALPTGLALAATTGAVTGTPSCAVPGCAFDFTLTADNGYGTVSQRFTGTLLPIGIPPSWDDDELGDFQVGVPVGDGVTALGDPDIIYTVTVGALPDGVTLEPTSGILSGTPTTAAAYAFTITAENEFGTITADFAGTVAPAPELDLRLDFAPGTMLDDATTIISADGLKVGSSYVLTMYSTPRVLYTGTIGVSGGFRHPVSLPPDTPVGAHRLVLTGTAADGTPMQDEAWFSLLTNGRIGAISYAGPVGGLASTGTDSALPVLGAGALLVLGVGTLVIARSRTRRLS